MTDGFINWEIFQPVSAIHNSCDVWVFSWADDLTYSWINGVKWKVYRFVQADICYVEIKFKCSSSIVHTNPPANHFLD